MIGTGNNALACLQWLAQCIQRRKPTQKIVVFSNYINASVRKRCAQLGVDAVFDKSTEIDALLDYCVKARGELEMA